MAIETKRLLLRKFNENDLQDLHEYLSDPDVVRFEPYPPYSWEQTKESLDWRINSDEMMAVEWKENQKLIGNVFLGKRDFHALEMGFVFNKAYWNQGFAKEACQAMMEDAFQKGIHRIFAEFDPRNPASWRLLESLGFVREAHLKENVFFWTDENGKPIWKDTYIYSRLNR
jgi:RimJ/RimL family protein N-acetyltransferase